ncbi:ribonuclease H-like domain-containing protein [Mycena rebaudengoi]|nr:ribonuclease H-like domain-containing protein [Mycena rebaudengoi]
MSPLYRRLLLPHPRLDVLNLSRYLLPPMATDAAHYNHIPSGHQFFSKSNSDDQVDIDLLKQMLVPPPSLIGQLRQESRQRYLDGYESICLPDGTLLPIWVLDMWSELQVTVQPNVDGWAAGIKWLRQTSSKKEVNETLRILGCLCWTGLIPTDPIHKQKRISSAQSVGYSVLHLTKFLSRDWFSCREIDQMLDVIWDDIKEAGRDNVQMMDTVLTTEIITQYEKSRFEEEEAYDPTADNWLARFGRELKQNTELAGIFHVGGTHWIGTTVDVGAESIGYGDPLDPSGGLFDTNVCDALRWFTRHHVSSGADTPLSLIPTTLACTLQADDWNCGLFAPNAIGHEFLPEMYPLLTSDIALGDVGRLTMLQRIIRKYHAADKSREASDAFITLGDSDFLAIPAAERFSRDQSPVDDLSTTMNRMSVSPQKQPARKRTKTAAIFKSTATKTASAGSKRVPHSGLRTKKVTVDSNKKTAKEKKLAKVKARLEVSPSSTHGPALTISEQHEEQAQQALPSDVSDSESTANAGRPRSETMDSLLVEVKTSPSKARAWRCIGTGCTKVHQPRSHGRVYMHAKRCLKLSEELRRFASKFSAATSPSAEVEALSNGLAADAAADEIPVESAFFGAVGAEQVRQRKFALADLAIVKLVCAAALPPSIADYPEWKEVIHRVAMAGPHYKPVGRTILLDNHIMSEQERVRGLQIAFLRTQENLALTFDAGDLVGGEAFMSYHASTSDGRSFLLDGIECTRVSHTGVWIAETAMRVVAPIGIEHFTAVSSDDTGNTRLGREIICTQNPTILNLPDPNHHLSNTCRDILKLPYFTLTIKILRSAISHFSHSKQSKAALKDLRVRDNLGRGLEAIGKTRFATVSWSGESLRRCLPGVRHLASTGQTEIKKYNDYFIDGSQKTLAFEMKLQQMVSVTEGIAKAIQCLEAASCNPADVYLLWLAVTAHIRDALADSMIPEVVCNEIRGIINYRWRQFFVENPGHDAYLATFYLNPKYVNSSIFKRPNAVAEPTITIPGTQQPPAVPIGVRNPKTFLAVAKYLFDQATREIKHGSNPVLTAFAGRPAAFARQFKAQFGAYAQGSFPFNTPIGETHPADWWASLKGSDHGGIMAALAIKHYSATPHSMADERTVSVITWMNPALRNREKVDTVMAFAQIRGWYRDAAKQAALKGAKLRAKARPFPEVKFYNIQRDIHSLDDAKLREEAGTGMELDRGGEDEDMGDTDSGTPRAVELDWLDQPSEVAERSAVLDLDADEEVIDLTSVLLKDVLADHPVAFMAATPGVVCDVMMEGVDEEDESDAEFELGSWL